MLSACIAVLLITGSIAAHQHTKNETKDSTSTGREKNSTEHTETKNSTEHTESVTQATHNVEEMDLSNHSIVPLQDILLAIDENTVVQLTNLQFFIPVDLNLGNLDPDFSKMVLSVDSMIGSLLVRGDYAIYTNNMGFVPLYSQGEVYINYTNVTISGMAALALTPAALLALNFDFKYNSQILTVRLVPLYENIMTEEVLVSKEIMYGTIGSMISKEVEANLHYYVDVNINLILSKISVFTVGHMNDKSMKNEPFKQNVPIGELFDEMMGDVKKEILWNKKDDIDIQHLRRNFSEKLESKFINGTFSATQGWVSGLSSLKRSSNVSLSKNGEIFTLSALLQFDDLEMGYDKYEVKFLTTEVKGELDGGFLNRLFTIKIDMDPKEDGTCISTLNEFRAFRVNGYRIKTITEIGSLDWLKRKINNWLIGFFQTKIVKEVERELSTAVFNSLSRFDCGEYLPHLKIL